MNSCGTLGDIGNTFYFPIPKQYMENALDTFFIKNPQNIIPDKWKAHDNWNARGYNFLSSRIFYFSNSPEEMYYVTYFTDSLGAKGVETGIGLRAVFRTSKWQLDDDLSSAERKEIDERFHDEIIQKLEIYTKTKFTIE